MRVALMTGGLGEVRGGSLLMLNMMRSLVERCGVDAHLYTLEYGGGFDEEKARLIGAERHLGRIHVVRVAVEDGGVASYARRVLSDVRILGLKRLHVALVVRRGRGKGLPPLRFYTRLVERIARDGFNVLHMGAWSQLYTVAASMLRGTGLKRVLHMIYHPVPAYRFDGLFARLTRAALRDIISRLDYVTVSTPYEERLVKSELGVDTVSWIGEWIDVDRLRGFAGDATPPRDKLSVIYLGAKSYAKGYYHAVLAVRLVARELGYDRVRFTIIGRRGAAAPPRIEEETRAAYRELIEHGVIREYEYVDEARKARLLAESHVLLLPSRVETFPLAGLEALALGRRVVVASIPTVESLVDALELRDYVKLVEYGDVEGAAEAVIKAWKEGIFTPPAHLLKKIGFDSCTRLVRIYEEILA